MPYVLTYLVFKVLEEILFFMRSATTQLLPLQALPWTEYRDKWVSLEVILIALLLICLEFKVFEGELWTMRSATIDLVLLQAFLVALSTL